MSGRSRGLIETRSLISLITCKTKSGHIIAVTSFTRWNALQTYRRWQHGHVPPAVPETYVAVLSVGEVLVSPHQTNNNKVALLLLGSNRCCSEPKIYTRSSGRPHTDLVFDCSWDIVIEILRLDDAIFESSVEKIPPCDPPLLDSREM